MSRKPDPHRLERSSYAFHLVIETQYGDMDANVHVNNVAIARYYEAARTRALMALLEDPDFFRAPAYGIVLAEYTLRFLAEVNFPEPVVVGTGPSRIGRSSFGMAQALFQQGRCVGLCDAELVLTDGGRSMPIPDDLRARMEAAMAVMQGAAGA